MNLTGAPKMKLGKIFIISCILLGANQAVQAARTYEELCWDYKKACENNKCGVFADGHIGPIIYRDVKCIGTTILVSTDAGKWRVYNEQNDSAGAAQYDDLQPFNTSLLKTKVNNKWGLASNEGIELLPAKYEDISTLTNSYSDYLLVQENKKWKIFHTLDGKIQAVSNTAYDKIEPDPKHHKGYYLVTVNGKKGMIYLPNPWQAEKTNLSYVEPLFDEIVLPQTYNFVKVSQNNKWGFYDLASGKLVTRLYNEISNDSFSSGMFKISLQGKQGLLVRNDTTKALEEKLAPSFDNVKILAGKRLVAVSKKAKWGVYDLQQQKLVLDPVYEDIRPYGSTAVQVLEQGKWVKKQF